MNTLSRGSTIAASLACWAMPPQPASTDEPGEPAVDAAAAVTAAEDLMREHGVLNRLLLVYEAALSPPASGLETIHEVLHGTASLIRSFIEDYHGLLEERFIFPEFDRNRAPGVWKRRICRDAPAGLATRAARGSHESGDLQPP